MNILTQHYLACALWSTHNYETDEAFDASYTINDFSAEAIAEAENDIKAFLESVPESVDVWGLMNQEQLGHDLWLTRHGHGAGFWDRGYGELGDILTELAHSMGNVDIEAGDDGKLYFI